MKISTDIIINELIKKSTISLIIRILAIIGGYLFSYVVISLYGPEALGIYVLALTILLIASVLARLGLDTALIKFTAQFNLNGKFDELIQLYKLIMMLVFLSSLLLSVILYFSSSFIANNILNKTEMIYALRYISFFIFPLSLIFIHSEGFRGLKKIIHYSIFRNTSIPLFASFTLLIMYFLGYKNSIDVIWGFLLTIGILSSIITFFWIKGLRKLETEKNYKNHISKKDVLSTSLPMMLTSSMLFFVPWTATIILGIYCSPLEIAIYDISLKISSITSIVLFAINSIAAPMFVESFKNNFKDFNRLLRGHLV